MTHRESSITPLISGWHVIFFLAAIGLLLGVLLSFLRPLEYSSTVRVQITQELGAVDAYTAARSAERIADDLATAVYFSDFFKEVLSEEKSIDSSYFPSDEEKLRKKWSRAISTSVSRSTGILTIRAYHTDIAQAEILTLAVADHLTLKGWTYTSGSNITVRLVDEPLNSQLPVRPNILINAFSGFVLGAIAGTGYILIEADRRKRRHQLVHE